MKENTQALNRCKRCNRQLTDRNAEYGWRCAQILGVSDNEAGKGNVRLPNFKNRPLSIPEDRDELEEYIRKSLEFYEMEQEIKSLMKDNPNIISYTVGDGLFWVDSFTFQGIGVLPDGTLIYGDNISLDEIELAKLVLLQEKSTHKTVYVPYINALAEKIAHQIGFTDKSTQDNFIKNIKLSEYYQIREIDNELRREFTEQIARYINAPKYPNPLSLWEFKQAVQNKSPGDLKNHDPYKNYSAFILDGEIVDRDALGNILYGFLGKYFEIPDNILYAAAGLAQRAAGTSNPDWRDSYYDDPRDQVRIKQGIEYYIKNPIYR